MVGRRRRPSKPAKLFPSINSGRFCTTSAKTEALALSLRKFAARALTHCPFRQSSS
ncbi:MAG: hypothetical protein ACTS6H_01420 [Candidatus Hodgkinia cicadicola]